MTLSIGAQIHSIKQHSVAVPAANNLQVPYLRPPVHSEPTGTTRTAWDRLYDHLIAEEVISPEGEWLRGKVLPPLELCEAQKKRLAKIFETTYCVKVARGDGSRVEVEVRLDEFISSIDHHSIEIVGGGVDWILGREFYEPFLKSLGVPHELLSDELFVEMSKLPQDIDIRFAVPYIQESRMIDAANPLFIKLAAVAGIDIEECIDAHKQKWAAKPSDPDKYAIVTLELYDAADKGKKVVDIDFLYEKSLQRKFLNKRDAHRLQVRVPLNGTATLASDLPCAEEAFIHYVTRRLDAGANKAFNLNGVAMSLVGTTKGRFPCVPTYFSEPCKKLGDVTATTFFNKIVAAADKHAKKQPLALQAALFNSFYFLGEVNARALVQQLGKGRCEGNTLVEKLLRIAASDTEQRRRLESHVAVHALIGWGAVAHRKDEHTVEIQCSEGGVTYSLFTRLDIQQALDTLGKPEAWEAFADLPAISVDSAVLEGLPLEPGHRDAIDRIAALESPAAKHFAFLLLLKYHNLFPSTATANILLRRYEKVSRQLPDKQRENAARLLGDVLVAHPASYTIESMLILRDTLNQDPKKLAAALLATKDPILTAKGRKMPGGKNVKSAAAPPAAVDHTVKARTQGAVKDVSLQPAAAQAAATPAPHQNKGRNATPPPPPKHKVRPAKEERLPLSSEGVKRLNGAIVAADNLIGQRNTLLFYIKEGKGKKFTAELMSALRGLLASSLADKAKIDLLLHEEVRKLLTADPGGAVAAFNAIAEPLKGAAPTVKIDALQALAKACASPKAQNASTESALDQLNALLSSTLALPAFTTKVRSALAHDLAALAERGAGKNIQTCTALLHTCTIAKMPLHMGADQAIQLAQHLSRQPAADNNAFAKAEQIHAYILGCAGIKEEPTESAAAFAAAASRVQNLPKAFYWAKRLKAPHPCVFDVAQLALTIGNAEQKANALILLLDNGMRNDPLVAGLAGACMDSLNAVHVERVIEYLKDGFSPTATPLLKLQGLRAIERHRLARPRLVSLLLAYPYQLSPGRELSDADQKEVKRLLFTNALRCLEAGLSQDADLNNLNTLRLTCAPDVSESALINAALACPKLPAALQALRLLNKQEYDPSRRIKPLSPLNLLRALDAHAATADDGALLEYSMVVLMAKEVLSLVEKEGIEEFEFTKTVAKLLQAALAAADRKEDRSLRMGALTCAQTHSVRLLKWTKTAYPCYTEIFRALPKIVSDEQPIGTMVLLESFYKALAEDIVLPIAKKGALSERIRLASDQGWLQMEAFTHSLLDLKITDLTSRALIEAKSTEHITYLIETRHGKADECLALLDKHIYSSLFFEQQKDTNGDIENAHKGYCLVLLQAAMKSMLFHGREERLLEYARMANMQTLMLQTNNHYLHSTKASLNAIRKLLADPLPSKVKRAFDIFYEDQEYHLYDCASGAAGLQLFYDVLDKVTIRDSTIVTMLNYASEFLMNASDEDFYSGIEEPHVKKIFEAWQEETPRSLICLYRTFKKERQRFMERQSPFFAELKGIMNNSYLLIQNCTAIRNDAALYAEMTRVLLCTDIDEKPRDQLVQLYDESRIKELLATSSYEEIERTGKNWIQILHGSRNDNDVFVFAHLLLILYKSEAPKDHPVLLEDSFEHLRGLLKLEAEQNPNNLPYQSLLLLFPEGPITADKQEYISAGIEGWVLYEKSKTTIDAPLPALLSNKNDSDHPPASSPDCCPVDSVDNPSERHLPDADIPSGAEALPGDPAAAAFGDNP